MAIRSASLSEAEMAVYRSGELPDGVTPESIAIMFREVFPFGCVLANSARELWRALIISYCSLKCVKPTVAMPCGICEGMVQSIAYLASVDMYDHSAESGGCKHGLAASYVCNTDIVLVGNLGGKREELPQKRFGEQVVVDDACQCADGICGFREGADFGLFSFGYDKPLFAGGGGLLCSCNTNCRISSGRDSINLRAVQSLIPYRVADWRAYLMILQLVRCRGETL